MKGNIGEAAGYLLAVLILLALVVTCNALPCEAFRWSLTKDIPARCLSQYTGGGR